LNVPKKKIVGVRERPHCAHAIWKKSRPPIFKSKRLPDVLHCVKKERLAQECGKEKKDRT